MQGKIRMGRRYISPTALMTWERWLADLPLLLEITVSRYFKSYQLDEVKNTQLHHFLEDGMKDTAHNRI